MKVKGITTHELRSIVRQVSAAYGGNLIFNRDPDRIGNYLHFTLRVRDSSGPGARRGGSGRRTVSACWHAHRDVMRMIFETRPNARMVTALAVYDGRDDFNAKFPVTGKTNVGSPAKPVTMASCCDCNNHG